MNFSGLSDTSVLTSDGLVADNSSLMMQPDGIKNYEGEIYDDQPKGEYTETHHVLVDGGDRFAVSAVAFDGQEELLWMGNQSGHVTSYYSVGMQKYTSFQMHMRNEIRQIMTIENQILSLTCDNLICFSKFGRPQFVYSDENFHDMQTMLMTGPSTLLMGGHQTNMQEVDITTQQLVRQVECSEAGCAILKYHNKFICAGDTSGKVTLRDPKTYNAEHVLEAHSATLSDFDVHGNQLITCGFSNRMGNLAPDRFLMIYDLRVLRAMSPLQVVIEPMFLRIVPTYTDRVCIISQNGQFQLLEQGAMTPASMMMYHVQTEGASISAFDISASRNVMAFGDHGGYLHLFTSGDDIVFNQFSSETEFAPVEHFHPISIDDEMTPLSIIPMIYPTNGKLLSDWKIDDCLRIYRKPPMIDPDVIRSTKMVQNIGYAPNHGAKRRNQIPYKNVSPRKQAQEPKAAVPDSPIGRGEDPFVVVPKRYRKVEIKYSKLGVEDFDFRHYNKTNYAGLEIHIPNAYCNAMLQVLYFIEPLRCALLSHLCHKEFCLACELGFLFHMLDVQKGRTCQASNFLRAFRTIPEASALGLSLGEAEEAGGKVNFARLIQNWNRFIPQQVHSELVEAERERLKQEQEQELPAAPFGRLLISPVRETPADSMSDTSLINTSIEAVESQLQSTPQKVVSNHGDVSVPELPKDSIISQLLGTNLINKFKCRCGEEMIREMKSTLFDLTYPEMKTGGGSQQVAHSFSEIVKQSMCLEQNTQAWCNRCNRYQPHVQSKTLKGLPDILVFNCHLENQRDFDFWKLHEELVRKAAKENAETQAAAEAALSHIKMCRYGNTCTRKDCRFRHDNESERRQKFGPDPDGLDMQYMLVEQGAEAAWVPLGLKLRLGPDGIVEVENIEDDTAINWQDGYSYYELLATVSSIREKQIGGHLVSQMKVGETYHQRKEKVTCTQWYLFNDFSILPIEKYEAIHFNLDWKIPCVLYFARRDLNQRYPVTVQNQITSEVLFQNASVVTPRRKHVTFTPLDEEELPKEGDVVGLDAEFVTLNQEEAELRSDGTRSTIKPSQLAVARVSCIRGHGALEGEPFLDDYISTQEQVVDYLTQFSGIKPGDLDASISSKHLTTLKSTYLKLRYLVDLGVTFVGHGLKKDFRVLNLIVPQDQIIDTVELFHLPRQRMISLKFLAWYFLGINIQSVMHDSIEDARTALKLYHHYQKICKDGMDKVRVALKGMYDKGYSLSWKIPSEEEEELASQLPD